MVNCPLSDCRWEGTSIDQYFHHAQRMHDPLQGYVCIQKCGRLLTSITSLRKHMLSCREKNKSNEPVTERKINHFDQLHEICNQNNIEVESQSTSRENDEDKIEVGNQNVDSDTGKLVTVDTNRLSMSMTLKWLSENGLARKVAFDINKDIKQNVIEPLSSVINDLQMTGAMTNECKELLDTMLGSYNCTSEYKCIQQLKKDGLYEDPTFFTINEELLSSSADPCFETVMYLHIYFVV